MKLSQVAKSQPVTAAEFQATTGGQFLRTHLFLNLPHRLLILLSIQTVWPHCRQQALSTCSGSEDSLGLQKTKYHPIQSIIKFVFIFFFRNSQWQTLLCAQESPHGAECLPLQTLASQLLHVQTALSAHLTQTSLSQSSRDHYKGFVNSWSKKQHLK